MKGKSPHPVAEVPGMSDSIGFIRADRLASIAGHWERFQDLPADSFVTAASDHYVLAISHGWCYQAHPDPHGVQAQLVASFIDRLHHEEGLAAKNTLVFLDFVSTPQHAFAVGQGARTKEQSDRFARALRLFPQVYLMADATLHINGGVDTWGGMEYVTTLDALRGAKLEQMGCVVQVVEWGSEAVTPFDSVVSIGGKKVQTLEEVNEFLNLVPVQEVEKPSGVISSYLPMLGHLFSGCACAHETENIVVMRRSEFGMPNNSEVAVRGWVYLERFVSMVKVAMVPESKMDRVAFSDDPQTLEEIFAGGRKLRAAAANGRECLKQTLAEFVDVLNRKRFKSTSVDKLKNIGGVGGVNVAQSNAPPDDADVVRLLMEELAEFLATHWEEQIKKQQHRQLLMAITRNSLEHVRCVLEAGADPNRPDSLGLTSLHVAAALHRHEIAKLLLQQKGNLRLQDELGNTPAHKVALLSVEGTVHTFALMAPSKRELTMKNGAGITPYMRFEVWVQTELVKTPFTPAAHHLEYLHKTLPDIGSSSTEEVAGRYLSPVHSKMVPVRVSSRSFEARVWEPVETAGIELIDIVCLSFEFIVPSRLAEPAWHSVARATCQKWVARMWVLDYTSLSTEALQEQSWERVHGDCVAAIEALPIPGKFMLVDSSLGEMTPLIWRLQPRISTVLIINFRGFHSEDFATGDLCGKVTKRFGSIGCMCEEQDYGAMSKLLGDYAYSDSEKGLLSTALRFSRCAAREPTSYFDHAAFHCRRIEQDIMERTKMYQSCPPLWEVPGIIACGAFAPAMWTLESAPRLRDLLPQTTIQYIHKGKSTWAIEGLESAIHVSKLMDTCIKKAHAERRAAPVNSIRGSVGRMTTVLTSTSEAEDQYELNMQRWKKAKKYFKESVQELASEDVWMPAADVRYEFNRLLLVDARARECRSVSTIPGAVGPEDLTDDFWASTDVASKAVLVFDDIGVRSASLLREMQRGSAKNAERWKAARAMELGLIGWCHEGGMLEAYGNTPTLAVLSLKPFAEGMFPDPYGVQVGCEEKGAIVSVSKLVREVISKTLSRVSQRGL